MKKLYIVERYGVYQQGLFGVFEGSKEALAFAQRCIAVEPDDYHTFAVSEISVRTFLPLDENNMPGKCMFTLLRRGKKIRVIVEDEIS